LIAEFGNRVLAFDRFCAQTNAMVYADLLSAGKRVDFSDSSIAAIARHHNFAIATRNLKHFEGAGVTLINPWVD
jgi:predicted nucleic acid-binding protein